MPLSMTTVIHKMAAIMGEISPPLAVHDPTEAGTAGLPEAIFDTPAVILMPGSTLQYAQSGGDHQLHEYHVQALVFASPVGLVNAASIAAAMGYVELLIDKFADHVRLTWDPDELEGVQAFVRFERQDGMQRLEWSASEFFGWVCTLRVREDATRTFKVGG